MKKLFALSLIVAASCPAWVAAADFPIKDKPVTIVVPASCRIAPLLVVMFSGPVTFPFDSVSGALAR